MYEVHSAAVGAAEHITRAYACGICRADGRPIDVGFMNFAGWTNVHLFVLKPLDWQPSKKSEMPRYYFDIQENDATATDEAGLELPDLQAAEIEAAQSLVDMAKNMPPGLERHDLEIVVRTDDGPVFTAAFNYKLTH